MSDLRCFIRFLEWERKDMDSTVTTNAMSSSLLARDVYCVCFPARDGLDVLHGEFAAARKKYFTGGKKAVRVGKNEIVKGFDGKLQGKLTRRSLYWKKSANRVAGSKSLALEETFEQKGGHVLVTRDFRSVIVSRVFFDRQMIWLRSEYYEPWDAGNARVTFKPSDTADLVERFDWDAEQKRSRSTMLYPVPYLSGTAEQSILNARFGEPQLIVSTGEGDFCYCPEKEADARKRALTDIHDGTIVLMPAWEVKDGSLAGEEGEEETAVTFTSLEEYARIEPPKDAERSPEENGAEEGVGEAPEQESRDIFSSSAAVSAEDEFTPSAEEEHTDEPDDGAILAAARRAVGELPEDAPPSHAAQEPRKGELTEDERILAAAKKAAASPIDGPDSARLEEEATEDRPAPSQEGAGPASAGQPDAGDAPSGTVLPLGSGYRGTVRNGKLCGRIRTEQQGGLTAYDGEYEDGKRHGFGSSYNKEGTLSYAGHWQNDKKDGLGVSFRDSDHALHIANWKDGKPGGFVSLFDKDGNLRYGGRIEDGKKQGAGVSVNGADGTVFVNKWQDGEFTGIGSAFDRDGNLLYYGYWKDGKRSGHGTEFDQNGGIVFDGDWKDDKYHNGILYQKLGQDSLADTDTAGPYWDL